METKRRAELMDAVFAWLDAATQTFGAPTVVSDMEDDWRTWARQLGHDIRDEAFRDGILIVFAFLTELFDESEDDVRGTLRAVITFILLGVFYEDWLTHAMEVELGKDHG